MLDRISDRRLVEAEFVGGPDRGLAANDGAQQLDLAKIHYVRPE
jgi:hypothetical protein